MRGNDVLRAIATVFERHASFHFDDLSLPLIYLIMLISGCARTFGWAARSSFLPTLVPREIFANAVTWNSSLFQVSSVVGPGLVGFLIVRMGFPFVYALDATCGLIFFLLLLPIQKIRENRRVVGSAWKSLAEGIRFVFSREVILATITIFSRCSWAERRLCCRFLPIKSCTAARSGWAGCGRRRRLARL